ncbi:hypothetical protein ANANG_G00273730 [Anguilla anguilla]|uniref:Uncharacterized protein n=1 Tax=Anguilla anguilla TaxID=7936 RepID=A0A9D3RJV4_ANGAN|nr:hypothetical protein ANANG_G00273730 [Anguilla anguilla]
MNLGGERVNVREAGSEPGRAASITALRQLQRHRMTAAGRYYTSAPQPGCHCVTRLGGGYEAENGERRSRGQTKAAGNEERGRRKNQTQYKRKEKVFEDESRWMAEESC